MTELSSAFVMSYKPVFPLRCEIQNIYKIYWGKFGILYTIPNGLHPEWTQSRMDTSPNGHQPKWNNPECTPSRMHTIPNGHNPE